jgi:uncharacterized repeat protein (TIGR01451 family)
MRRAGGLLVGILAGLALGAPAASAATFDVSRFDDPDPILTPCVPGDCSLRAAVIAANAAPGSTINVPAGRVVLSIPPVPIAENSAVGGDLDIEQDTTIAGAGAGSTTVDGGGVDRVFDMPFDAFEGCLEPDRKVSITGLTITGGRGELNVNSFGGQKFLGGGGIVVCGQLTLTRSVVTGNEAVGGGGGIVVGNNSSATIDDTTVSANRQGGDGAPGGGAILVQPASTPTIVNPALLPAGVLTMTDSTVSGNTAGGGGQPALGEGGGILNLGGVATLTNVTVSGNTAGGGGAQGFGGGIFTATDGTTTLLNSTVASNSADTGSGGNLSTSNLTGGGLDGNVSLKNTIVAGGTAAAGSENCNGDGFASQGNNLEDRNQCGAAAAGDQRNLDPRLGPLAGNGGPTQTRALLADSPAINTAANAGCPATDQRGTARPQAGVCDVGAFELVWQADLAVTKTAPASLTLGQGIPYTLTVTNLGPQPAQGVTLRDVLPARATLTGSFPAAACAGSPFDCAFPELPPGASHSIVIGVHPLAPGTFVNTATVAGTHADPNPANNTATASTAVSAPAVRAGLEGVPATCRRTDFTIRARATTTGAVRSLRVLVDGRQVATRRARTYTVRIRASRLRPGRHRIVVEARGTLGQLSRRTVSFVRCPSPAPRPGPRFTG